MASSPPRSSDPLGRRPPRRGTEQNLEVAVGGLSALTVLMFAVTAWAEVTGRPALTSALLLLLLVIATVVTWKAWQRVKGTPPLR